ncbi:NAD-dependent epimerase/dehydratase family protein [Phocaeicola abscessus]|uniref:NAD-dependent epimerase/dehydratase family protein n=1 Tax=Phocaeicola abscessus TaxID=555313 RepID=UPI0028E56BE0|nr:NAD-dependent epimerase/dehydratase family protein [Phocaeicola abscessus]
MKVLVTGAAGFIGSKLMELLAKRGDTVTGIDNINTYYNPNLKYARLAETGIELPPDCPLNKAVPETGNDGTEVTFPEMPFGMKIPSTKIPRLRFIRMDIVDTKALLELFKDERFDVVVNLAAQAGVRYSLRNPFAYIESNVMGFMNILECCRHYPVKHLVYASSSSVYGLNSKTPFSEDDEVSSPVSIYAATKKSNELMAHAYAKLYSLPSTGLRFFTVYGPWGRPDMAPMLFAEAISKGKPIDIFNHGDLIRDFTYIDDIANGTIQAIDHIPDAEKCPNQVPTKVYNIGCSHPVKLMDFINEIETALGKTAVKRFLPMQQGDVYQTNADTTKLEKEVGYQPQVKLHEGIMKFVEWYQSGKNPLKEIKI